MKVEQRKWDDTNGWIPEFPKNASTSTQLVLVFGAKTPLLNKALLQQVKKAFPKATIFGCSTAGEIINTQVLDDSLVVTSIEFEHTQIRNARIQLNQVESSYNAGECLAKTLPQSIPGIENGKKDKLVHVIILSEGLKVNGSELVKGLVSQLPENVSVTGGLAGDGEKFIETLVISDGEPHTETISAIGLYGNRIKVGFSSMGGWDSFGPERLITRSKGNKLYELDGHSALELYKKYLGEHAKGLPATGLLFPLYVRSKPDETGVVRTILSIDENEQSMTFAGDIPESSYARFMKANFDRLIDGSIGAAKIAYNAVGHKSPELAILISCGGRKLILKQRIEEEIEGVRDVFGESTILAGFYSYGEISPFMPGTKCELNNQSMAVTIFLEE